MVDITGCTDCVHDKVCKYQEGFKEEVELLVTIQNKFDNAIVSVQCHCFNRSKLISRQNDIPGGYIRG